MVGIEVPLAMWAIGVANGIVSAFASGREAQKSRELQRQLNEQAHKRQFESLRESHALQERLQRLVADLSLDGNQQLEQQRQDFQDRLQRLSHAFQSYHSERMRGLDASWPLKSMPMEIVDHHVLAETMEPPLLVMVAPPRHTGEGQSLGFDVRITESLRHVLDSGYDGASERPVRLLGDIWKPNGKRQEAAMASLHTYLSGVPMVILDSEIEAGVLYFRIGYQSSDPHRPYFYKTFTHIPLVPTGTDDISKSLLLTHQVMACTVADLHYLMRSDGEIPPALPSLLPRLLAGDGLGEADGVARMIMDGYSKIYGRHFRLLPWGPDLALDFAESLAHQSPELAQIQLDLSIELWLSQNGFDPQAVTNDPLDAMASNLKKPADHRLYARARRLLSALPSSGVV